MGHGFERCSECIFDVEEDDRDGADDDDQVVTDLFDGESFLELSEQKQIVDIEVHSEHDHEDRDDPLNVR